MAEIMGTTFQTAHQWDKSTDVDDYMNKKIKQIGNERRVDNCIGKGGTQHNMCLFCFWC
jgi:hypothetical protein